MKLNELLERYPWDRTQRVLWGEPPAKPSLSLDDARQIVRDYRGSQTEELLRLMVSPVVRSLPVQKTPSPPGPAKDREESRTLRDPRRTARLFVDQAAREGKNLRLFETSQLRDLGPEDGPLAELLQTLAVALDLPRAERRTLAKWNRVAVWSDNDLGPVLTPMLTSGKVDKRDEPTITALANELAGLLEIQQAGSEIHGGYRELLHWTGRFTRQGHRRLTELGVVGPGA